MQNCRAASFLLTVHLQPRCALDSCCWAQDVLHSLCGTCEAFLWAVRLAALVCVSWGSVCLGPLLAGSRGLGTSVSVLIRGRCRVLNQVMRGNSGLAGGRHWLPCVAAQPNLTSSPPNFLCFCVCHSWYGEYYILFSHHVPETECILSAFLVLVSSVVRKTPNLTLYTLVIELHLN